MSRDEQAKGHEGSFRRQRFGHSFVVTSSAKHARFALTGSGRSLFCRRAAVLTIADAFAVLAPGEDERVVGRAGDRVGEASHRGLEGLAERHHLHASGSRSRASAESNDPPTATTRPGAGPPAVPNHDCRAVTS